MNNNTSPRVIINFGLPAAQIIELDNALIEVAATPDNMIHKDELTGERAFWVRGQHRNYEITIHVFKAPNVASYYAQLKSLYGKQVVFYRHRNINEPDRDKNGNVIYYTITEFKDGYVDELTLRKFVTLKLESASYVF